MKKETSKQQQTGSLWTVEIEQNDNGEPCFKIPDEVMERLGWSDGTDVKWTQTSDGWKLTKINFESIELELEDDELFNMMKLAHNRHMSFDEWVGEGLQYFLDNGVQSLSGGSLS